MHRRALHGLEAERKRITATKQTILITSRDICLKGDKRCVVMSCRLELGYGATLNDDPGKLKHLRVKNAFLFCCVLESLSDYNFLPLENLITTTKNYRGRRYKLSFFKRNPFLTVMRTTHFLSYTGCLFLFHETQATKRK